jgi:hypothetical protein
MTLFFFILLFFYRNPFAQFSIAPLFVPSDSIAPLSFMTSQTPHSLNPPLLRLPSQVRSRIYGFLFAQSKIEPRPPPPYFVHSLKAYYQILFACRLFLTEARSVFFRLTTWIFRDYLSLRSFLIQRDPDKECIERICCFQCDDVSWAIFKLLPRLKVLQVWDQRLWVLPRPLFPEKRLFALMEETLQCLSSLKEQSRQQRHFNVLVFFKARPIDSPRYSFAVSTTLDIAVLKHRADGFSNTFSTSMQSQSELKRRRNLTLEKQEIAQRADHAMN